MQLIRNQNSLRTSYRRTEHVRVSTLEIQPIVHYMSSKYDSIYVMEYMYTGLTFRFIHCYIALWRVRQEQMTTTRYRYGFGTLHPGQVLSGSNFRRQETLRPQRRQRSYGQKVELFYRKV
jgi:hypothetical protein